MSASGTDDIPGQLAIAANMLSGVSDTPRLDAELLLAHALGVERDALLLDHRRFQVPDLFANLVARRMGHEPVAYIIGYRDFWTIRLSVGAGVLIPRPDSETLIEAAVDHFEHRGPATILDLGTGPGTLLLAALDQWPDARGTGVDICAQALAWASGNAVDLGMADRATFIEGGWDVGGSADLILCNPPYISTDSILMPDVADHEPHGALFAGDEGLDAYRAILPGLARRIRPGGCAVIEIGATQRDAVSVLVQAGGLRSRCLRDIGGRDRALLCLPV